MQELEREAYMEERARTEEEEMTLEEAFVRLDGMVERLETRGIPLEESFQIYKEGMELLKKCNDNGSGERRIYLKIVDKSVVELGK